MSYATVEDYAAKYGAAGDEKALQAWLDDATAYLASALGGRYDAADAAQAAALRTVCRDMVHRAYASVAPGYGVTSWSQGSNGFSEQVQYANATGDLYLTKAERRLLGLGSSVGLASVLGGE